MKKYFFLLCLFVCTKCFCQNIIFINPGRSDELYWTTATKIMQSTANSFGMNLEVRYAERDHFRLLDIANEIVNLPRKSRPQFVIFTNDYGRGPEMLKVFDQAHIKTFLAFNGIESSTDISKTGHPRERYKYWLGSLTPEAESAGYMTARALIEKARTEHAFGSDGKLHLLAIGGDRSSPTSIDRDEGMHKAVAESQDTILEQEVYASWRKDIAIEKSEWLYSRYPDAKLIWAGNDAMALGAMDAWKMRQGIPGKDAFFSGINTSTRALEELKSGHLAALAGGHFMAGSCALVLLYDYAHGRDFSEESVEMKKLMFTLFSPDDADEFIKKYQNFNFENVNFRKYSKVLNPNLRNYDFNFRTTFLK